MIKKMFETKKATWPKRCVGLGFEAGRFWESLSLEYKSMNLRVGLDDNSFCCRVGLQQVLASDRETTSSPTQWETDLTNLLSWEMAMGQRVVWVEYRDLRGYGEAVSWPLPCYLCWDPSLGWGGADSPCGSESAERVVSLLAAGDGLCGERRERGQDEQKLLG